MQWLIGERKFRNTLSIGDAQMKKPLGILVSGGPAPGINGVISAATIEAINRGHKVYGIYEGFKNLIEGDTSKVRELDIQAVSRIHSEGGSILRTSRANPKKSPEMMEGVVKSLKELGLGYLITIGGDDTASSAWAVSRAADIAVGHVPKTIDNDLPLPGLTSTFGFQSARERGTQIVETLMEDAKTTGRWYLVVAMGRKAGHLAQGIGISSGATLTVIPEEFEEGKVALTTLADIVVGSVLKRLALGRNYGVAVLAEGLAEVLDIDSIPELRTAERDPHGHIRFAELDFGGLVKHAVRSRLKELGIPKLLVVDKNVGYELRCHAPNTFDREYTRELGFGIVDYLLGGGSRAMITLQNGNLIPIPFDEFIDEQSKRSRIRRVDRSSSTYKVARKYMIRMSAEDLRNDDFLTKLEGITTASREELKSMLLPTAEVHGS